MKPRPAPPEFLVLVAQPEEPDWPLIGRPKLYWRGQLLDFPITGTVRVDFDTRSLAKLTLEVPVAIATEPPTEAAA